MYYALAKVFRPQGKWLTLKLGFQKVWWQGWELQWIVFKIAEFPYSWVLSWEPRAGTWKAFVLPPPPAACMDSPQFSVVPLLHCRTLIWIFLRLHYSIYLSWSLRFLWCPLKSCTQGKCLSPSSLPQPCFIISFLDWLSLVFCFPLSLSIWLKLAVMLPTDQRHMISQFRFCFQLSIFLVKN